MIYTDLHGYEEKKREYEKMGLSTDHIKIVDMNYGFVPTDLSQKAKGGSENLTKAAENIKYRFGL